MLKKIIIALIAILGITFLVLKMAAIKLKAPYQYEGNHPETKGNTISIFLIDGLRQSHFQNALNDGELPFISKLIDEGLYIENGIASFPTMTGYGFYPFLTGVDAARSGILGLRWFDRSLNKGNLRNYVGRTNVWMNQDVRKDVKTIFEQSGAYYTSSINTYMNKGVIDAQMTGWAHTSAKYEGRSIFGMVENIPFVGKELSFNHFTHEDAVAEMAKAQLEFNPKVQWVTFPSPDASNHINGTTTEYHELLKHIDGLLADFWMEVKNLEQDKQRMLAIVTDHGISDVDRNIDLQSLIFEHMGLDIERGASAHYKSMMLDEPIEAFLEKDGFLVVNGNLACFLYFKDFNFRDKEAWREKLNFETLTNYQTPIGVFNIPEVISTLEGIEMVVARKDEFKIRIWSDQGVADIFTKEDSLGYFPQTGNPLRYHDSLHQRMLHENDWLEQSIQSNYPDALYRLAQLFESPNMGDLLITSKKGFDFGYNYEVIVNNYKGGHGGIRADQIRVPYILYPNPNVTLEDQTWMRAEEVGKIIIEWLNMKQQH